MRDLAFLCLCFFCLSCQNHEPSGKSHSTEETRSAEVDTIQQARTMIKAHQPDKNIDAGTIFKQRCAVCHGVKGNLGVNGAGDLTQSSLPLEERVAIIYYGKGTMTPFKGILSDAEVVELALYVALLRGEY